MVSDFAIPRGPTPRILVADPDGDIRARYRDTLHAAGCDVLEARDGRDALAKALSRAPSLIVTETLLPFIDGYALCALLRHDSVTRTVPILVVTTETRPAELARARAAGADMVIVKPVAQEVILNEIRRLLVKSSDPRGRSQTVRRKVAAKLKKAADLIERTGTRPHPPAKRHERYATTTPPQPPPQLICPSCRLPLKYVQSHIGGVNSRHPEQYDDFTCPGSCGAFQYRQRTRKLRKAT